MNTTTTAKSVTTNGYQTAYYESGSGKPVILIHGGGAGADALGNWRGVIPLLETSMHVFAYDMVGFGNSDSPDPASFAYTQTARNEQLAAFVKSLPYERVNIVGNSMGGATALGFAMQRPEHVENLVLMGAAGLNRSVSEGPIQAIVDYDFTREGMRRLISALANTDFVPTDEMVEARFRISTQPEKRASYAATMGWIKKQGGLFYDDADIAKITSRALVFNGKNDQVCPMSNAIRFLELLENSHGYLLPHCGHWAMIEYPEIFSRVTLDFLRG